MKKLFTLIAVALIALSASAQTTLISYNGEEELPTGIAVNGTTVQGTVKIHTNADVVNAIKLANGYTTDSEYNGNAIILTTEGGFKDGDVVSITGVFNNSDDTKQSAATLFSLNEDNSVHAIGTTQQFINGRLSADDPLAETITVTGDHDILYIGRSGNTSTFITSLSVVRPDNVEVLWSRSGQAWDPSYNKIADVRMIAYSDGTYTVTNWQGNEGYDLDFSVTPTEDKWVSQINILNSYGSNAGYTYVMCGDSTDTYFYTGSYLSSGYSACFGPDLSTRVLTPDPEGGMIDMYTYAYDGNDKMQYGGYYYVTWGPDYSIPMAPFHNGYNEKGQTQTSQMTLMNQDPFDATLKIYDDGTYILKNWEGVDGYDLKFTLGENDSITVLNDNAERVVTSKGSVYWRVPTGRTDYDRACIYTNSASYNQIKIAAERASITFGCSYIYPVGSNSGTKAYYSVRGYNADSVAVLPLRECKYDYTLQQYVDTVSALKNGIDSVTVYKLTTESASTYYAIPDWLGPTTGDLYFSIDGDTLTNITVENSNPNGLWYYYMNEGSYGASSYDYICPGYYYTVQDSFMEDDGYMVMDIYYMNNHGTKYDSYYCVNLKKQSATITGDVNGDGSVDIADVNAIISVICGGEANSAADVNGDGSVDIADVNSVISIICGA